MAEPLKNLFSANVIKALAGHLDAIPGFRTGDFLKRALAGLDRLELKERSAQITDALDTGFDGPFETNVEALLGRLHPRTDWEISEMATDGQGIAGWSVMPLADYVARHGLDRPEFSLAALRDLTMRSSSEFAIRPFFRDHTALTLRTVMGWLDDPNVHVRRLISEGSRPRLPWGMRLGVFVDDPSPLLSILERLRDDPSEYVRRSVANNLNDIAKDHPALVSGLARDWLRDAPPERAKLVKHACRTLIKAGDPETLAVFGYGPPDSLRAELTCDAEVTLGGALAVSAELTNGNAHPLPVLIDLVLWFRKADGRLAPKVFKWTETTAKPGAPLMLKKSVPLREVTTRRHYPGAQAVALQVNGVELARASFDLHLPG